MNATIVPMFLTEMDGLEASCAFVIIATNRADMLDPAVTRDGRLDLKVHVGRPSKDGIVSILERYLREMPLDGMSVDEAADIGAFELSHPRHVLYMVRTKSGKGDTRFCLSEIVSGAMCKGLVDKAVDVAIARERTSGKEGGLRALDLAEASDRLCAEQFMLDHPAELGDLVRTLRDDYKGVERPAPRPQAG